MFITSNYINHKIKTTEKDIVSPISKIDFNLDLKNHSKENNIKTNVNPVVNRPFNDEINIENNTKKLPPTYNVQGKLNMKLIKRL